MSKKQPEYHLQVQVCEYIRWQYPKTLCLSDTIAATRLTIPQQVRNKAIQKSGFKCPDLVIYEPKGMYHGLFIELKIENPFKHNGELKSNEHLEAQQKTLFDLTEKGYWACFAWSFDQAKLIIDNYMKQEVNICRNERTNP